MIAVRIVDLHEDIVGDKDDVLNIDPLFACDVLKGEHQTYFG